MKNFRGKRQVKKKGKRKDLGTSLVAIVVKNPPANAGDIRDAGSIPGLGRSPGGGYGHPLQNSSLENPKDRGSWRAIVHRVAHSRTRLKQCSTRAPVVQWLRLQASKAGGIGSIPNQGTKIPHAVWCGQKKKILFLRFIFKVTIEVISEGDGGMVGRERKRDTGAANGAPLHNATSHRCSVQSLSHV